MNRVEIFAVTVPAGTLQATPQFTAIPFDIGDVQYVEILIPPGPSGLAGFGIMHGGASVYPREENRWIVSDNEKIRWEVDDAPTAGDWTIRGYNTDVFDHTFFFRFLIGELRRTPATTDQPLAIVQPDQPAPIDEFESGAEIDLESVT